MHCDTVSSWLGVSKKPLPHLPQTLGAIYMLHINWAVTAGPRTHLGSVTRMCCSPAVERETVWWHPNIDASFWARVLEYKLIHSVLILCKLFILAHAHTTPT